MVDAGSWGEIQLDFRGDESVRRVTKFRSAIWMRWVRSWAARGLPVRTLWRHTTNLTAEEKT